MKILYTILLLVLAPASYAQMYKWVDEEGKIHYSQVPPAVKQQPASVQKIEKSGALLQVEPEKRGHYYYCGDLLILSGRDGDQILHKNIKLQIRDWEVALNEQKSHLEQLKQPGKYRISSQIQKEEIRLASYDCRVRWGYEKLREFSSFGYEAAKTNRELQQRYEELEKRRDTECPADSNRFGHILVGEEAREWYACHDGYSREMKAIKRKMADNIKAAKSSNP